MNFGEQVLRFYQRLKIKEPLPDGIGAMNPYQDKAAFAACAAFYTKFYSDHQRRYLIVGINPGRFGAGITGIPFTDPVKLQQRFGIETTFQKKTELSADYIYMMIDAFGGAEKFFGKFFINSVSPLGFVMAGKNLNYYDTPALKSSVGPFIRESMQDLAKLNVHRSAIFCLGEGANFKYLTSLNQEMALFEKVIPLAHPRFIMQYKRRQLEHYLDDYLKKLNAVA